MTDENDSERRAAILLRIVAETLDALRPQGRHPQPRLNSRLDSDLGFDSLGRVELLARLEKAFGVSLGANILQEAATPAELLKAIDSAPVCGDKPSWQPVAEVAPVAGGIPDEATTLVEVLRWQARVRPDAVHIIVLDGEGAETRLSYAELLGSASRVAGGLQDGGLLPGQTVAIMLPTGPEYFFAYFGILLAGGVPVPIYPPARLAQIEEHVRRHAGILANAEASFLITVAEAMPVARLLEAGVPGLRRVVTASALMSAPPLAGSMAVRADDTAFIQYTSGSTGDPKGVVLSHANLLANIRAIGQAIGVVPDDVVVSWLPLYHDMGLIAAWLSSLYHGIPFVVMSPLVFLARPERWLWAIHRYHGTLTAAPNFAYELCCRRIDEAVIEGLDLATLRMAANGAEPVNPATLERFHGRFASHGLKKTALMPVYGLAESSVGLAIPTPGREPRIDRVERETFSRWRRAVPVAAGADALSFVGCGHALPGHEIRIVDEAGIEVGERIEGRLLFRGPSSTSGYFRRPDATARLRLGDWLDSGDRAYLAGGEVFLTGRVKDIIIRGGRNVYPHEVESAVGVLPGVRNGCVAVFGSGDEAAGTERLIVLAETALQGTEERTALEARVVQTVVQVLGEPPDEVVLVAPHSVLKTSSGKLRRSACRQLYEQGELGRSAPGRVRQMAGLAAASVSALLRRSLRRVAEWAYAGYVFVLFALAAVSAWCLVACCRRETRAWSSLRGVARGLLRLAGIRLHIEQGERLPASGDYVLVANHASYLDGLVLVAWLETHHTFVAKRELQDSRLAGVFLRRLGVVFVERFAAARSAEDAGRVAAVAGTGARLAIFPEGTFTRQAGLRPFLLGAFSAAAGADLPVVPVALRGTRAILRGDSFFARRGDVWISVGEPVLERARAGNFEKAVALRDRARAFIREHCGEPSLE